MSPPFFVDFIFLCNYYNYITLLTKISYSTYNVNSGRKKQEIYVPKRESGRQGKKSVLSLPAKAGELASLGMTSTPDLFTHVWYN